MQEQSRGDGGPVTGVVIHLDAGDNKHTFALAGLLHRLSNAAVILSETPRGKAKDMQSVDGRRSLPFGNRAAGASKSLENGSSNDRPLNILSMSVK
jgi:hypothetical protein